MTHRHRVCLKKQSDAMASGVGKLGHLVNPVSSMAEGAGRVPYRYNQEPPSPPAHPLGALDRMTVYQHCENDSQVSMGHIGQQHFFRRQPFRKNS